MKLYGESISVRLGANNLPAAIRWRLSIFQVQAVEEQWSYTGKWWTTPATLRGRHRCYYRLACVSMNGCSLSIEIYQEGSRWMLSRVLD